MGATEFTAVGYGRDLNEAFNYAYAEADAYYGHQEGYSGAINAGVDVAATVAVPPRTTASKVIDHLRSARWDDEYADAAMRRDAAKSKAWLETKFPGRSSRLIAAADAKRSCVALEVTGATAAKMKASAGFKGTQKRVFVFAGVAPC